MCILLYDVRVLDLAHVPLDYYGDVRVDPRRLYQLVHLMSSALRVSVLVLAWTLPVPMPVGLPHVGRGGRSYVSQPARGGR
tara:strand:+ start:269 stop:511 length:243 start_codon:yes stop_codon:yes gene_type:complete